MTIGLICAIPQELTQLRMSMTQVVATDIAQVSFVAGRLDGHSVVLAGAGMGKVNAAVVTSILVNHFDCRAVVFSGIAGGLDPALTIGDVVIADRAVQYDAGIIEDEQLIPYQPGHIRFFNPTDELGYPAPPDLLTRIADRIAGLELPGIAEAAGGNDRQPQIVYGTVLTGDAYLHCGRTRDRLHREFGGLAVEMEGGAVAQVCAAFDVPWLVIRTLSDLAGEDLEIDFTVFADQAAAVSATIVRAVLDAV
jgi:adenosylhomocysteine nucleosidase